ncbi:NADP-dependent 3-hydroxy acid dehydrogenase YdfG [Roseovarius azorensis]|uniref:NADP-dependent 3-hydroxy acid dehydrogenase YdfG n=1 Tax=Roseovarius azorensis TaxID=1287727 RepID=A0A1H7IWK5_9RHOB|nr:SDR family oxidoreductase [Roseovarius azorensis]SEK66891.1 NADP-dependent 3-hydroxy acid dehydrogenase YdfG [Roseovarius azorensis]
MKTVLITGASAGIGAACARAFLDAGWQVGLMARRREALEAVAGGHDNAVILPGDVTDPGDVVRVFEDFIARAGRLDVLFNNAGSFGRAGLIDELSFDEWRRVVDVNLHGMFLCARAAFAQMRNQTPMGGRIINNGSISAHAPREGSVAYTTTKHAITGLTRTLSLDGRPYDIACGQIDIGNARTELLQGIIAANPENPPPTMDVAHVGRAVLHMAGLPPEANVQFMTLMATKMPYIGRG